ncbi:MAG: homocysteine S-methyltransferase family protein, partial [Ectothiorhodospiraceae bacterium]
MDESNHSNRLPQLGGGIFLTDAGIETTLIFHRGLDLPHFAAVNLLRDETDTAELEEYFRGHAAIALDNGTGFIFEAATWRASPDWGTRLGYSPGQLDELNRRAIRMLRDLRTELQTPHSPMVVSGCIGPRGDGYDPRTTMTAEEAESYHARQVRVFAEAGADLATAITMTNTAEAVGIVRAAGDAGLPAVISFTVETDGKLPTGESLQSAVETVD